MPTNIKATISLLVMVAGAVTFYLEWAAGRENVSWAAAALTVMMILGMWIFPEAKPRKDK